MRVKCDPDKSFFLLIVDGKISSSFFLIIISLNCYKYKVN